MSITKPHSPLGSYTGNISCSTLFPFLFIPRARERERGGGVARCNLTLCKHLDSQEGKTHVDSDVLFLVFIYIHLTWPDYINAGVRLDNNYGRIFTGGTCAINLLFSAFLYFFSLSAPSTLTHFLFLLYYILYLCHIERCSLRWCTIYLWLYKKKNFI